MKLDVKCPCCNAGYKMNLPDEIVGLIPPAPEKHFVTICKKCAVAILFDGETWTVLPPDDFVKLPPDYQEHMLDIMKSLRDKKAREKEEGPPTEGEFFLQVVDNPAGWPGAPIIHKGPPQWDRMKYIVEAHGNKRISAVLAAIRQLNGIKQPPDDES